MLALPRITAAFFALLLMSVCSFAALAQEDDRGMPATPLRLSYIEGSVSFWRPGAENWVDAQLNTPLAAGDALYVGKDGDLELQIGSRAFVRADDNTQFSLTNQTADFAQFKVTSGRVSFDLRALPAGYSVEVDTPNAVFTIDHVGYYRVDVDGDVHFVTRRGGRAMMVPAGGQAMSIHPSEEIVVQGNDMARAETYVAPELEPWDRWNYERTDGLVDSVSERYLPAEIAGTSDLDHYGNWRVAPDYGPVWVPDSVPPGWAPYSTGRWSWDPYYQWTWIDDAPWGWAPFHYGRWVYLGGYWAWVPGPVVRHAVYAPAMVAFFGVGSHMSVGIGIGSGGVGWVALSWGEPLTPWWGRPGFAGRPSWRGWGGPRVVNNTVVRNTTVVNVTNITYLNTHVNNAVIATTHEHFGKGRVQDAPVHMSQTQELEHISGVLPVKPGPASLVAGGAKGFSPPENLLSRPVVATRPPHESKLPWHTEGSAPETKVTSEQRYVPTPKQQSDNLSRPDFGDQTGAERARPPLPPRFGDRRHEARPAAETEPRTLRAAPSESTAPPHAMHETTQPRVEHATPEPRRDEATDTTPREDLPGKPANRVYRLRDEGKGERQRPQKPD